MRFLSALILLSVFCAHVLMRVSAREYGVPRKILVSRMSWDFPSWGNPLKMNLKEARGVLMSLSLCVHIITSALKHIRAHEVLVLL
jgi:hypothetical protein